MWRNGKSISLLFLGYKVYIDERVFIYFGLMCLKRRKNLRVTITFYRFPNTWNEIFMPTLSVTSFQPKEDWRWNSINRFL